MPREQPRIWLACKWVGFSIIVAILYGILNDQVTVSLSEEYFSVFKRHQFEPILSAMGLMEAPTRIQSILVGALATWWFGLILGAVLSFAGAAGARPPISTQEFARVVFGVLWTALNFSMLFGLAGYLCEPLVKPSSIDWPFLENIEHVRAAFTVAIWHDGAYLGGLIGATLGVFKIRRLRLSTPVSLRKLAR